MPAPSSALNLVCCRPEFSEALREEWSANGGKARVITAGLVGGGHLPATPLVFEHQRLPNAQFIPRHQLKPITDATWQAVMGTLQQAHHRWTLHAWSVPGDQQARVDGVAHTLVRLAHKQGPGLEDLNRPPHRAEKMDDALVLQLCLTEEGLWHSTAPMSALTARQPAGLLRMKDDPQAPSRSYLKVEEAFYRMNEWPQPGQRVIDLGAAPGGWTLAFAKRGSHVIAIDNGPLRLPDPGPGWGSVEHLRQDGLLYTLPAGAPPVDWLVADMLVAPGRVVSLLRHWLKGPSMLRFVVNMKLPEGSPMAAIRPLQDMMAHHTEFRTSIRHLYHDREEITVMGQRRKTG